MLWAAIIGVSSLSTLYSLCLKILQKDHIRARHDFFLFSFLMNLVQAVALLLLPPFARLSFSRESLTFGTIAGLLILANYLFMVLAMAHGPLALTNSLFSINMLIPIVYGLFYWDETLSVRAVGGLVLFIVSILFVSNATYYEQNTVKKTSIQWLIYVLLSFLCGGTTMILSKQLALIRPDQNRSYLLVYIATNMVLSVLAFLFLKRRAPGASPLKDSLGAKYLLLCLVAGTAMAGANTFFMRAIGVSSSAFFFPATRGLGIILMLVLSSLIFRERLSRRALSGFILNALAILLLSLG